MNFLKDGICNILLNFWEISGFSHSRQDSIIQLFWSDVGEGFG